VGARPLSILQNRIALHLNLKVDPKDKSWAFTRFRKSSQDIGSIFTVWQDKKAISPQRIEASRRCCRYEPFRAKMDKMWCNDFLATKVEIKDNQKSIKEQMRNKKFETGP
jgi:hypothetical protein